MTTLSEYYPGTAVRFSNVVTVLGVRTSLAQTFELRSQNGSTVLPGATVVRDTDPITGAPSVGSNYCDLLIPLDAPPGVWAPHWQAQGVAIDANHNDFYRIRVKALPP